ncbi:MAG: hypothetical protein NTU78_02805, partial [Alphaproteobacteria bacterium]|nr:hypothetical protein [Alphaproteobacteria bacterium]
MLAARLGQLRREGALDDLARRRRGNDVGKRGCIESVLACEVGAGGDQHRSAFLHIARDIAQIGRRQDRLAAVAVEDHEIELVELVDEKFARRKRDQRQFLDRRAVLFFRRAENGEMHQVDRRIGLEQVAPGTFAGMRLAGHQQYAQPVAYALDHADGAVVLRRDLAFERRHADLGDVLPAMTHRDRHLGRSARRDRAGVQRCIADAQRAFHGR